MWQALSEAFGLGLSGDERTTPQLALRAALIFVVALVLVRLSNRRFMAKHSAFDLVLAFMLGSMLSRAINGSAPLFPTFAGAATLVALHWIVSALSYYSHTFAGLAKGHPWPLIRDGRIQWSQMRKACINEDELRGALRENGELSDPDEVRLALLESDGHISVLPQYIKARLVEVPERNGDSGTRFDSERPRTPEESERPPAR